MTFEIEYADWISKELNKRTTGLAENLVVRQSFETAYEALKHSPDAVALILNGGNASHSAVEGVDQNVMPLLLTIICDEAYKIKVLNALNDLQKTFNAVPITLTYYDAVGDADIMVNVKTTFNTPFILDERDLPTDRKTLKATYLQMSASVLYGANAFIAPVAWKLRVDNETYDVEHISSYDLASQPGYDEYVSQGSDRIERNVLSRINTFHFVLYKTGEGGRLQQVLDADLLRESGGLAYGDITLIANAGTADETSIPISYYTLSEHYVNNAAAYELLLGR